jgi:hypothetical protein
MQRAWDAYNGKGRLLRFHVLPSYEAALSAAPEGERGRERAP